MIDYYLSLKIKADNVDDLLNRLHGAALEIERKGSINISNKIAKIKLIKKEIQNDG